jgi:chromosome segregation ATPase
MFITEKFQKLSEDFKALEATFNSTKADYDASATKIKALETQVSDLSKVKSELESKLKVYGENPNALTELNTKVSSLTKENTDYKAQVETLTKEKLDATNKLNEFQKEMEQKINIKASEVIANGKLTSPLPITADIPVQVDISAFLEELEKKPNTSAKAEYIKEHPQVWKEVLSQREKFLKGRK